MNYKISLLKKTIVFALLLVFSMLAFKSEAQVSLTFSSGYLGTQASATQQTSNIKNLSTLGIARVSFSQSYPGTFGGTQGNDLSGIIRLYMNSGQVISLNGALNWRETTGNSIDVFGLIFDLGQNATITYGANQTYNIIGGSTNNTSTSLGLKAYASSVTFTDGAARNGNAATSSIIGDMNAELASSPQPSSISLTNTSVIESQNLVYTVTLSTATTAGRPQVYTFNTSGTATKGADYNTTYTFSNGVVDNGDGTITVPGSVSSFTITISTIDDVIVESIENVLVSVGSKTGLGSIADNDAPTAPNCDVNNPYDKIVSGYHQSIALKTDASFAVWGEDLDNTGAGEVLTPRDINVTNYPNLVGTPLKATIGGIGGGGKEQAVLLTTDGLYVWGSVGYVINYDLKSTASFGKIATNNFTANNVNTATGLPLGVNPYDVKMLTATYGTLVLLTNAGDVWTLSGLVGISATGNTAVSPKTWFKAKIDATTFLTGITAIRVQASSGSLNAIIALKSDGTVYTWGSSTYLGDGSAPTQRTYATKMTLPAEFSITNIPKMIAVTGGIKNSTSVKNSYYILSNSGALYSLGYNAQKQLGDFTTTERTSWVNAKINLTTNFSNVSFITAQEHDASFPGIAAVTKTGDLYTWGDNEGLALGRTTDGATYDPGMPLGFTSGTDIALSAELGGHTLVYLKQGTTQFCYVGHKTSGSMGDGVSASSFINTFNCSGTPSMNICGSVPVAASTTTSTITANPTSIVADGTTTSVITVQLKQANGTNLTSTGGTVIITTNKGTISSVTDNNDGTYTAILTSSTFVETATLNYTLNGANGSNTASVNFIAVTNPVLTTTGTLKTFTTCSGCTVAPQSFTVSGVDLSSNNIVVTAPTGVQVSTNSNTGFATSINIAPTAGTVTTTTVYAKLTINATSVASGVISVTSTGAAAKTITVTTNTDNALNFDGTNDYVVLPSSLGSAYNSSAFTIEAWIKTTEAKGVNEIIGWGSTTAINNVVEFRTSNGKLQFILNDGTRFYSYTSSSDVNTGKWMHVAVVKSGTNVSLYINGQIAAATAAGNDASTPSVNAANIGLLAYRGPSTAYGPIAGSYFNGGIDQLRVWNTARSASDILANMFVEMAGNETGLLASYDFNQGTANGSNSFTTLNDNSTNAYNGTLTGFTLSGTTSNFVTGFIPEITAAGNATVLARGNTLQLSNGLVGGVWSTSNASFATVNASTGLVTGVASGSVNITYTICDKTVSYALTVVTPTITVTGTLKQFTTCSGCTIPTQSFTVAGTNLGSNVIVTAPTGFEVSNALAGTYSTTLSLTPSAGTLASTNVFARLINSATIASNGNFTVVSTGAASKTVTATVNKDNAMNFDGVDDIVSTASNITALNIRGDITVETWIRLGQMPNDWVRLIGKGSNSERTYGLWLASNGSILWQQYYNGTSVNNLQTNSSIIPIGQWTHIAVTRIGSNVKIYINGIEVISSSYYTNTPNSSSAPLEIGGSSSMHALLNGSMDEVRIWNIGRTSNQIANSYLSELAGDGNSNETGLVAYYNFNQGTAGGSNSSISVVQDRTSNGFSGTLTNFAKTGSASNFVAGLIPEISGNTILNTGFTTTYTNALTGGTWSSSSTNIASVNATTGVVTGVAAGNATITYTICEKTVSKLVTVVVPTITTTGTLNTFSTCLGTASAAQTFTVSAQYLTANLVLTAPTGYEISTNGATYSSTLSIAATSGSVSARSIFVRLSTASVNGQSGNVAITSTDAVTKNVATGVASVTRTVAASVTISSNASNNAICAGTNVVFTATPTNGGSAPTYQWKLNGNNITGANSATYSTTTLSNNDIVTVLMGSSLTSCVTASPATSNSITTTVTSIPATPGNITGQSVICMNSNQVYSIAAIPGATSYTWVVTGDLTATTSTTNVLNITAANNAGSGTIKVLASNVCGSSVYSNVFSVTVSNQPAPTASFTVSGNTVCLSNAGVTFTSTSTPNATTSSTITTYAWAFGDGATASTATTSNTYTSSGSYDAILTITDANQCTSSISSRITVDPISVAGTASAASTTICEGSSTVLTLTGNTGTIQWQISTDGINFTNITGETTASYTTGNLTATAYYRAVVTSGACSSATSGVVTVTVSPTPSVNLGQVANIYATATSFDIIYNSAIGTPDEYSIRAVGPNALPNFNTISNYGLTGSPITVAIPASVAGTYNFNLTVANGALGCVSTTIPFTLTVAVAPPANLSYTTPNVYTVGGGSIAPLNPTSTGGPITTYSIGPSLPAGLTIDPTTGIISGTPSAVSTQTTYTVTGTNASGTVTATVVITVNVAPPASLSYNTPNIYTTGTTITPLNPSSTGGPITQYTIGPSLPAGLTIDPSTGIISGTPTATSPQTTYTVTGVNASGTITATLVITVNSGIAPQPQGSLNALDYGLLAADTVKLRLTTSNGTAPFTLILNNSNNSIKDTITGLTPNNNIVEFLQKRLDTTKVFTIFKLIDANNNTRTSGFTKDTTIVRLLKPQILLTLKADPAVKQPDNSFKIRLLMKIKNAGHLNLRNVQVNANLSTVFPSNISYILDSVRVLNGNLALNPSYTGAGSATSASNDPLTASASANTNYRSLAVLDQNYVFNSGVSLNQNEEGEVAYYISIGATAQNVVLKLQFETAGDGFLVKNDGSISAQGTTSISDDGTNIAQHPDITNQGLPLPTYVPLFPNESIGASLNVGSATPVTGGYQYHFTAKIKNYGNVNLDSLRIQYNFNAIYPNPDQAVLVGTPTITRGNIVYNTNSYDGYNDVYLYKYGGDLQVGDSATYEYDLKVLTNRVAYTWPNYFVAYGRSINSGVFVQDTSMAGINPDPNNDNDPIEKFYTGVTINYVKPGPPTVENKIYNYADPKPSNIGGLVKSTPTGTIPVWCNTKTAACSITPPATPTEIGKYIYALRSYDTTTLLYSEVLVYDTVIIKPPVPLVVNKKYIIGANTNPNNISGQVTGMTGSLLNYFKNAGLLNTIPTLGVVPGVTRYTTSQTVNNIESDTVGFTVTMLDPKTMLHLQKIADEPKLQTNSTFNITYTFLVNNRTDESMSNVLVVDNLQNTFPQPTAFTKVSLSSTGGLTVNNGFNGMSDINLLSSSSSLAAFAMDTIRLTINLQPKGYTGTVNNVAVITATTPYGVINMNSSSKSFANETSKAPTPSVIPDLTIDIPEAFSPNRDGVNDYFVILKPFGTTLELEVYNRWGNVVYYNSNYNNQWEGRGTNNFIGQDLMDGGYYYTLKAKSANGNSQIFKGFVLIQR